MTCFLRVLYLACSTAMSLPGAPAPACTTEPVMVVAVSHDAEPIEGALFEVLPEKRPVSCIGPAPLTLAPVRDHYPACLVGDVEVLPGEDRPAVPKYIGACCSEGCACAGQCEWLPWGGPPGYEVQRLGRMGR